MCLGLDKNAFGEVQQEMNADAFLKQDVDAISLVTVV